MSWLQSTLLQDEEEEIISQQTSECGFSYSECSSLPSEPLDLSMKPWFKDGSPEYPFTEAVSSTNHITLSNNVQCFRDENRNSNARHVYQVQKNLNVK